MQFFTLIAGLLTFLCFVGSCSAKKECNSTVEVMFVVDGSNSINSPNFAAMLQAIIGSLPTFSIAVDQMRVGVVIYGPTPAGPVRLIPLSDNERQLISDIHAHETFPDDTSNTAAGIQTATLELTTRGRHGVPKVMVVMTDGGSNDETLVRSLTAEAKQRDITIFAVGVGPFQHPDNLADMASDSNVYSLTTFPSVTQQMKSLSQTFCVDCSLGVDLVFVLDGSNSVGITQYRNTLGAIQEAARSFSTAYPGSRLGLVIYSTDVDSVIYPTDDYAVFDSITDLPYPDASTGTAQALLNATSMLMSVQKAGVAQVMVVITDGRSNSKQQTVAAVENAKAANISIFAIGVGERLDKEELDIIGSKRSFVVDNFDQLNTHLTDMVGSVCTGKSGVLPTTMPPVTHSIEGMCLRPVDLLFLVDSSSDVGSANFRSVMTQVADVTNYFLQGDSRSRVGAITYSSSIQVTRLNPTQDIRLTLTHLRYNGGSRMTYAALQEAAGIITSERRPQVPYYVIVLIAGPSDFHTATMNMANRLQDSGVTGVYVVELSEVVNRDEINAITGNDASRVYRSYNYNRLQQTLLTIAEDICLAP